MTNEEKQVIDDFEGKEEYEKTMKNTGYYIFSSSQVLRLSEGNKNVED